MYKKLIAGMLSLAMVFGTCNLGNVLAAEATSGSCGETATFELSEEGVLTISGTGVVENAWADFDSEITSVVVEEGITEIAGSAFEDCGNLVDVTLPEGLESIGQDAFYGCASLEEVAFPETLVEIGASAFEGCTSLVTITVPEDLVVIETKAFYGCSDLEEVILSEKTEEIKADAFSRCENLTAVTVPEGTATVAGNAFYKVPLIHNMSVAEGSPWGALAVHRSEADNCPVCYTGSYTCEHKEYERTFAWAEDYSACTATFVCEECKEVQNIECEVKADTTEAECTVDGKIVYTATCEYAGNVQVDQVVEVLEAPGHQYDKGVVTKEPTEEATGTIVYTCEVCEEKVEEVLDKLEHEYSVVYTWAEDNSTCTATFTCANCDDVQDVECEVTSDTKKPTCTEEGMVVYTATCEFNEDTYITNSPVGDVIPATGHSFDTDPVWTWAEDLTTATAVFACSACDETEEIEVNVVSEEVDGKMIYTATCEFEDEVYEDTEVETLIPFTDVEEDKWYYEFVVWAYENDVADGIKQADGTYIFQPNANCTRAQFVQFLWNIAGTEVSEDVENPFTDIEEDKWYYAAVMWAVENGVTYGFEQADGTYIFQPNATCTRAQAAQFIYNLLGEDVVIEDVENPFTDIEDDKWYYNAVLWGTQEGIIAGIEQSDGTFKYAPDDNVTRAQVVTMISCAYEDAPVEGIALTETEMDLVRGESIQLEYVLNPTYAANKEVKWTSSDKTVAKVSSLGVVTAIGYGPVTITATTEDGGYVATCVVNVIDPKLNVKISFSSVWVTEDGAQVQGIAVKAEADGGSEVYEEYQMKVFKGEELVAEAASNELVVTPFEAGTSYTAQVTVVDSHGNEAKAEKKLNL